MKHVVISGAGEVGRYAAEVAERMGLRVTIIETSPKAIANIENNVDARTVLGSGCHSRILKKAEVDKCDVFMAATSHDEVNLLSASIGKKMGAQISMARIQNTAYYDSKFDYRQTFEIDHFVCPEQLTAKAMVSDLTEPGAMLIPRFAQNEIELRSYTLSESCKSIGRQLMHLPLPPGVRVALVQRQLQKFVPEANTRLEQGDIISVIGPNQAFETISPLFGQKKRGSRNLVISHASKVGYWLLQQLDPKLFKVKVFEQNLSVAEALAEKYPHVTVVGNDPLDEDIFRNEHIENCHGFISMSQNQEHNIIEAMHARKMGVKNVSAVIQSSNFLQILSEAGINKIYCPKIEAAKALVQILDASPIKVLAKLDEETSIIYQVRVQKLSKSVGLALKDLLFPKNAFIAAIERENLVFCPTHTDQILDGDILTAIGPQSLKDFLQSNFIL